MDEINIGRIGFDGDKARLTHEYNHIFAFPTGEIRDVFFENFKDLIEQCKELL